MYKILIEHAAEHDLKHLQPDVLKRITPVIRRLTMNPRPLGCHKIKGSKNDWRIRVGEYRIIYEICDLLLEVRIMRIRHRKDVYRGFTGKRPAHG